MMALASTSKRDDFYGLHADNSEGIETKKLRLPKMFIYIKLQ